MSMPIQRQSESFGIFDDGPRYARDRAQYDLPKGIAGLINTTGPRIQAGLNNTRTASDSCEYCGQPGHDWQIHPEAHRDVADWEREKHGLEFPFGDYREGEYPSDDDHDGSYWPGKNASRLAVNTEGMNPEDHAYGRQTHNPLFGEYGHDGYDYEGVSPSRFRRDMRDRDLEQEIAEAKEDEDDESGYNWGPVPPEHYGAVAEDYSGGDEDDPDWVRAHSEKQQEHNRKRGEEISHSKKMFGSRLPFDRAAARRQANEGAEPWMNPEDFIKYHNDYFGRESDPITQDNIRGMSDHELHGYWKDLENARGKTPDQLREEREQGKARAKEIADGLWNAFYPPEEEEGRKSVQNMDTVGKLMDNGWQPEHIKYDEDDRPYGFYQHPSGWNVKDYGGMYKEIGHAATPGESHDVINVSHDIDGQDYHEPFGPSEAHSFIENQLHGDPEETGGQLQTLSQDHPAIKRYKPRQATRTAKGKCECWDGYCRVPGTEPCAEGSCRKCDSHRKEAAGLGGMFGLDIIPEGEGYDPDDFFLDKARKTYCTMCHRHRSRPSGPFCNHGDGGWQPGFTAGLRRTAFQWFQQQYDPDMHDPGSKIFFDGVEMHKAPLENGHELHTWKYTEHPDDKEGWNWAIVDPSKKAPAFIEDEMDSVPNPGSPPPVSSWLAAGGQGAGTDVYLSHKHRGFGPEMVHNHHIFDVDQAKEEAQNHYQKMFPIGSDTGPHDSGVDYSDLNSYLRHLEGARTADVAAEPMALAPDQIPQGGGYQIGHRVGLPWRGENIPGTVIGLSGPNVNIRWDDGQYSNEEPHNIQLL